MSIYKPVEHKKTVTKFSDFNDGNKIYQTDWENLQNQLEMTAQCWFIKTNFVGFTDSPRRLA